MTAGLQLAEPPPADATFVYMSETVGIAELRQNLSKYLRKVAEGERLVVTDRNRPVAELGPPATTGSRLDQLIAEGKVKPPKRKGGLVEPLKFDLGDDPEPLSRALEEVRGYR
jgi:prevent-host-death family protein